MRVKGAFKKTEEKSLLLENAKKRDAPKIKRSRTTWRFCPVPLEPKE